MRRASCPTRLLPKNPVCILLLTLTRLRAGLLLLLLPQSEETDTGDLDDLETDTGNITLGLALTTETGQEDLVVLIDEVQATVIGDCRSGELARCAWKGWGM